MRKSSRKCRSQLNVCLLFAQMIFCWHDLFKAWNSYTFYIQWKSWLLAPRKNPFKYLGPRQNAETEIPNPKYRNRKAENHNTEKQKYRKTKIPKIKRPKDKNTEWSKDRRTTIPTGQNAEKPKYRMSEIPKNKNV